MSSNTYLQNAEYNKPPTPALKFPDAEKFENTVNSYFESISIKSEMFEPGIDDDGNEIQVPTGKFQVQWLEPPTIVGLGVYLDCDYRIFQDYEADKYTNHPQMSEELSTRLKHALSRARQICHKYTLGQLYTAKSSNGSIFALKTVYKAHGYQEEITINSGQNDDKEEKSVSQLSSDELIKIQQTIDTAINSAIADKHQLMQSEAEDAEFSEGA